MATGTVREWIDDEGWGVIDSEETPGGCWAHFSAIVTTVVSASGGVEVSELKTLMRRDVVAFEWEASAQDGFRFRATRVTPTH